jgi:hypothetical protein
MELRFSTGFQNALASDAPAQGAAGNSKLFIFGGTRPTTANDASGTSPLVALQATVGTYAGDVVPTWTCTLSSTIGGTIGPLKISAGPFVAAPGGLDLLAGTTLVPVTDLTTTATALAAKINLLSVFSASSVGAVVTISAPIGSGTTFNSCICTATAATIVATVAAAGAAASAGVAAAYANNFDGLSSGGIITSSETWSGNCTLTGIATWFRLVTTTADTGTGASATYRRVDGDVTTIGLGGALELSTTNFLSSPATPVAVTGFQLAIPATFIA